MWPRTKPRSDVKEKVEIAQSALTIAAIVVGALWTYMLFIKDRQEVPHANIELELSHVALSEQLNLLRIGIKLTNTGNRIMKLGNATVWAQQILPFLPCHKEGDCAANEVKTAINETERQSDRFSWPLITERTSSVPSPSYVEPGEQQMLDYEFVIPSKIEVVRVYAYFENQQVGERSWWSLWSYFRQFDDPTEQDKAESGWSSSSYYDFRAHVGGAKK